MRKSKLPIVEDCFVQDYPEIRIGSDAWFEWLGKLGGSSFRYEPAQNHNRISRQAFTVVSRVRKGSGTLFWVAVRKADGKVRQEYLGLTEELDYERLQIACDALTLDTREYQNYKSNKGNDSNPNAFNSQVSKDKELEETKLKLKALESEILDISGKIENQEKSFKTNSATEALKRIVDLAKKIKPQS